MTKDLTSHKGFIKDPTIKVSCHHPYSQGVPFKPLRLPFNTTFTPSPSASKCFHHISVQVSSHVCGCLHHAIIQAMGFVTFARASRYSSGIPNLHGILHHTKDMFMGSIECQGPYMVIIINGKGLARHKDPTIKISCHHP